MRAPIGDGSACGLLLSPRLPHGLEASGVGAASRVPAVAAAAATARNTPTRVSILVMDHTDRTNPDLGSRFHDPCQTASGDIPERWPNRPSSSAPGCLRFSAQRSEALRDNEVSLVAATGA